MAGKPPWSPVGLPFALVGGVYGLWLRDLPLTMPATIGFVTLAGLSILNGMVLITYFNELRSQGISPAPAALRSAKTRLRPRPHDRLGRQCRFYPHGPLHQSRRRIATPPSPPWSYLES